MTIYIPTIVLSIFYELCAFFLWAGVGIILARYVWMDQVKANRRKRGKNVPEWMNWLAFLTMGPIGWGLLIWDLRNYPRNDRMWATSGQRVGVYRWAAKNSLYDYRRMPFRLGLPARTKKVDSEVRWIGTVRTGLFFQSKAQVAKSIREEAEAEAKKREEEALAAAEAQRQEEEWAAEEAAEKIKV